MKNNSAEQVNQVADQEPVKAYATPVLVAYGDVRDITLGPSVGGGESGCAAVFRNGAGGCP